MNTFQLKMDTARNHGLKYQIYTKELIQDTEINNVKNISKSKKHLKWQEKREQFRKLADTYGWRLILLEPYVKEIVKINNKKNGTQMNLNLKKANLKLVQTKLEIDEEDGVRLALLFKTVSRIRKMSKVDRILLNIKSMSKEETYYWYSKVFTNRKKQTGVRALRILIGS